MGGAMLELIRGMRGILDAIPLSENEIKHEYKQQIRFERIAFLDKCFGPVNLVKLALVFKKLGDEESRDLFIKIIINSMGLEFTGDNGKYDMRGPDEWKALESRVGDTVALAGSFARERIETFLLDGYSYGDLASVCPGDTVYDIGAYTGCTALYFSKRAGPNGKIYAFEPEPQNFKLLKSNIQDAALKNVEARNLAATAENGHIFITPDCKYWARATGEGKGVKISSVCLDEFIMAEGGKADFIKMDIEGGELEALKGLKRTLAELRPKLAIAVYHCPEDMIAIPLEILASNPDYVFFMKHNSEDYLETVMFGLPLPPLQGSSQL